ATCSEHDGPESPSTRKSHVLAYGDANRNGWGVTEDEVPTLPSENPRFAIFSAAASPARTSPSPDGEPDSLASDRASSSSSRGLLTASDLAGSSLRTSPASS